MSTLKEDLTAIKEIQDGLVNNKVARFSYTHKAYTDNTVDGVNEYNVNNEQNIPNGTASIMKVNSTVLDKGYRAQASSITRMLMNHFLGRISYNLNKINDNMQSLLNTLITKLPSNIGNADTATRLQTARTINIQDSTATNTGTGASFDGSENATIKLPATIEANIVGKSSKATTADTADKVSHSLTFGSKTYNGSSAQTITASDLGLLPPDLTKAKERTIVDSTSAPVTFKVPSDGWILKVDTWKDVSLFILIDGEGSMEKTPCQKVDGPYTTPNGTGYIKNYLNCPFPVKKGQKITPGSNPSNSKLIFAPCIGN